VLKAVGIALLLATAGCSLVEEEELREPSIVTVAPLPSGDDPSAPDSTVPTEEPCATLLAVDDPANDSLADADVADRYEAIVDLVPESIRIDLIMVVAGLRAEEFEIPERVLVMDTDATATTLDTSNDTQAQPDGETLDIPPEVLEALDTEPDAEGRPIPLLPVERVAAYVDSVCRGTTNNPGPPPGTIASGPDS